MTNTKWTHDGLMHDLAEHLRKPERLLWCDMQMGPSGSPRPDVYSLNKSYSSPRPISYEIKISVSDFRSDVTTGKWQKYLEFSSGVVFCVPQGLIGKGDIPTGCGLMVRGEEGWRTIKAATLQKVSLPQDVLLKLLIDGVQRHDAAVKIERFNSYTQSRKLRDQLGDDVSEAIRDIEGVRARASRLQADIDSRLSIAKHQAEVIIEGARREQESVRSEVRTAWCELIDVLGMPPESNLWVVRAKIRELANNLAADEHFQQCVSLVSNLESQIQKARKQIDFVSQAAGGTQ